jgi:hypothetical protein
MKFIRCLFPLAVASFLLSASAEPDWKPVEQILGREGEVDQGVFRVTFDRSDLKVVKDGVPISAQLVFDCWYGFWPMKSGEVMLMGDTCVREDELAGVEQEIHRQGLDLTALHNHLVGEKPKIMFLHLSGHGSPGDLARKVKAVLARTATPTGPKSEDAATPGADWSPITSILGKPAETEGDVAEFGFQRQEELKMHGATLPKTDALETAPEVKFQLLKDGRAVTYGEMILLADEVAPIFHILSEHGIEVDALHNHMTAEEPRLFFMHWWAVGQPDALARGVKAAVDRLGLKRER